MFVPTAYMCQGKLVTSYEIYLVLHGVLSGVWAKFRIRVLKEDAHRVRVQ